MTKHGTTTTAEWLEGIPTEDNLFAQRDTPFVFLRGAKSIRDVEGTLLVVGDTMYRQEGHATAAGVASFCSSCQHEEHYSIPHTKETTTRYNGNGSSSASVCASRIYWHYRVDRRYSANCHYRLPIYTEQFHRR